jgi:hypothetical protein
MASASSSASRSASSIGGMALIYHAVAAKRDTHCLRELPGLKGA